MPVAVRLSKNFYARFGDEATNELIGVINDVAQSQESTLKDAFAQHIAVFDAKLEQRIGALDSRLDQTMAVFDEKLERRLAETKSDLLKWMFAFWATNTLAIVGLAFAVLRSN
jgi:hypothetical protein